MSTRKKNTGMRVVLFILIFIAAAGAGSYGYLLSMRGPSSAGEGEIRTKTVKKNEPVNLLLMGIDIGDPKAKNSNDPKRTDTLILINYNPKTEYINMISIPRDTLIRIKGKNQKINAAYAIGGTNYAIAAVEKLLNIDVNYYGKVDYAGFRKIIDSIGGVDMKINNNMNYDDPSQNLSIHFKKGEIVHLDGKKAEEFFRWRKNNNGTGLADGDLGRIENQHMFIEKVVEKIKSPAIIPKIPGILSVVPQYVETNMKPEEIVKYGYIMSRSDKDKMNISTLKGDADYINGISYFIYSEKANKDLLNVIHGEVGTINPKNIQLNKDSIKVQILNGTSINGLASDMREKAKQKGYKNVSIGNGKDTDKSKVIIYGMEKDAQSIIKNDFAIDNIINIPQKTGEFDIIVLLGKDCER